MKNREKQKKNSNDDGKIPKEKCGVHKKYNKKTGKNVHEKKKFKTTKTKTLEQIE